MTVDYLGIDLKDNYLFQKFINNRSEDDSNLMDRYTIDTSNGLKLINNLKQSFQFFNADSIGVNIEEEDIISVDELNRILCNKLQEYGYSDGEVQAFIDNNIDRFAKSSQYVSIIFDDVSNMQNKSQVSFYIIHRENP